MALNKHMHPRNPYKSPPDFEKLAKMYAEFSDIAKADVTGKITIDFKDPHTLRVLTKCLLKCDFNIDVDIPEDRLVPTLPLRLNYILWIEDMLAAIGSTSNVRGLDIGTGACAIYPLLAAANNKWHMIGTETDDVSIKKAQDNVNRNNLQELIELKYNPTTMIIDYLFTDNAIPTLHFCMCNPPFYSNIQELYEARSPARPPPKNGFTGSPHELITEGGELEFCRKLISESKKYQSNILIFTTMVGHKYNLQELLQDLKADGIKHTHTEFCQGRVTRWGVAWTYKDYDIYRLVPPRDKLRKKFVPMICQLPELPNSPYNVGTVFGQVKDILQKLSIEYTFLEKKGSHISLDIVAKTNTWSHQRRKRRLMKREEDIDPKKVKLNLIGTPEQDNPSIVDDDMKNEGDMNVSIGATPCTSNKAQGQPIVHAFLRLAKKDKNIVLEFDFLGGHGGKESLHQIIQFIKNNWKYCLFMFFPLQICK